MNVASSPTDMSAKVTDSDQGYQIVGKTDGTSTNDVVTTKKAVVDASVPEKNGSTSMDEITKKNKVSVSVWQSRFIESGCQVGKSIRTSYPALGKFYDDKIKRHVDSFIQKFQTFRIWYEKQIKPNLGLMRLIHSVCVILWGGSWYSLALLLSFFHVYTVEDYTRELMQFPFDGEVDTEM